MKRSLLLLVALSFLCIAASSATAGPVIAYDNSGGNFDGSNGQQNFPGGNLQNWTGTLGLDFDVNRAITITALGAFDNGSPISFSPPNLNGSDGSSGITVGVFDRTTGLLVPNSSVLINSSSFGSQINGDFFVSVTPFTLAPGVYSVVALNDRDYNQGFINTFFNPTSTENSGGGLISFVGAGRFDSSTSFVYPTTVDTGPTNRYDAGTFAFAAAPEPATAALLGIGCVSMLGWRLRRKK